MVKWTRGKLPYFFMYAKDKKRKQVEKRNDSTVNTLKDIIPNDNINFHKSNVGDFDYKLLMNDSNIDVESNNDIIDLYTELDLHKYFMLSYVDEKENNLVYAYQDIKSQLLELEEDIDIVVDTLIKYLYKYKESSYKTTLWECFGDILVNNLKININKPLDNGWVQCQVCGKRIPYHNNRLYCTDCSIKVKQKQDLLAIKRYRGRISKKAEESL